MKSHHQLRSWGLWKYIEGPGSEPPIIPPLQKTTECTGHTRQGVQETLVFPGNEEEHNKKTEEARPWMDSNDLALSKIICAVPNSQLNLGDLQYAKEAWEALHAYYLPRNLHRVTSLKGDITAYRCGPGADIVQWLKAMGDIYNTFCCMDRHCMITCLKPDAGMNLTPDYAIRSANMTSTSPIPSQSALPNSSLRFATSVGFAAETTLKLPPLMLLQLVMMLRREDNNMRAHQTGHHQSTHALTYSAPINSANFRRITVSISA